MHSGNKGGWPFCLSGLFPALKSSGPPLPTVRGADSAPWCLQPLTAPANTSSLIPRKFSWHWSSHRFPSCKDWGRVPPKPPTFCVHHFTSRHTRVFPRSHFSVLMWSSFLTQDPTRGSGWCYLDTDLTPCCLWEVLGDRSAGGKRPSLGIEVAASAFITSPEVASPSQHSWTMQKSFSGKFPAVIPWLIVLQG